MGGWRSRSPPPIFSVFRVTPDAVLPDIEGMAAKARDPCQPAIDPDTGLFHSPIGPSPRPSPGGRGWTRNTLSPRERVPEGRVRVGLSENETALDPDTGLSARPRLGGTSQLLDLFPMPVLPATPPAPPFQGGGRGGRIRQVIATRILSRRWRVPPRTFHDEPIAGREHFCRCERLHFRTIRLQHRSCRRPASDRKSLQTADRPAGSVVGSNPTLLPPLHPPMAGWVAGRREVAPGTCAGLSLSRMYYRDHSLCRSATGRRIWQGL